MDWYQWLVIVNLEMVAYLVVWALVWALCIYGKHSKLWGAIAISTISIMLDVTAALSGITASTWLLWLMSTSLGASTLFRLSKPFGIRGMKNTTKQE